MMDKYKRWDERTVISPSGHHLGHFYVLIKPFKFKDDGDKIRIQEKT